MSTQYEYVKNLETGEFYRWNPAVSGPVQFWYDDSKDWLDSVVYQSVGALMGAARYARIVPQELPPEARPPAIKPPLGLTPREIWLNQRKNAILDAVERYSAAGLAVPVEWVTELKTFL